MQNMEESLCATMRDRERFNSALKAKYSIKGKDAQHQECQITNLSSSGATTHFPRNESLKSGSVIAIDIAIPNTVVHIAIEAEIMWTKQRFNELIGGIKFTGALSKTMINQLVTRDQQLSDYIELIW